MVILVSVCNLSPNCNSKMSNRMRFRTRGQSSETYMRYTWPPRLVLLKDGRRAKQIEIGNPGALETHMGMLGLVVLSIIWNLVHLCDKWPVTRKWLVIEWRKLKFGTHWHYLKIGDIYLWACLLAKAVFGVFSCVRICDMERLCNFNCHICCRCLPERQIPWTSCVFSK